MTVTRTSHAPRIAHLDSLAATSVILARLFLAPVDRELAEQLEPSLREDWPLQSDAGSTEAAHELAALLANQSADPEMATAVWRQNFGRAFRGPGSPTASPYESVHREEEGLVFGSSTEAVRAWYHRFGFRAPLEGSEPDDHIGLELHFVAALLSQAVEAFDSGDREAASSLLDAADAFTSEHLLPWAQGFADNLREGPVGPDGRRHCGADDLQYALAGALLHGLLRELKGTFR